MKNTSANRPGKTTGLLVIILIFSSFTLALPLRSEPVPVISKIDTMAVAISSANIEVIKDRIEEIRQMDKSDLSKEERTELKRELKEMEQQVKGHNGHGLYISFGGLIIIILLLILIL